METRMEKSKRLAKEKRRKRYKYYIIGCLLILTLFGLYWVNSVARDYELLENPVLFGFNLRENIFTFLGNNYYFDFKILKRKF